MTVSQRQFKLLTEMGISLWQRRVLTNNELATQEVASNQPPSNALGQAATIATELVSKKNIISDNSQSNTNDKQQIEALNIEWLQKHPIFTDILLSLNLKADDIQRDQNYLNKNQLVWQGLTWQFSTTENITLTKDILTTPAIADLIQSTTLKSQLWHAIQHK